MTVKQDKWDQGFVYFPMNYGGNESGNITSGPPRKFIPVFHFIRSEHLED